MVGNIVTEVLRDMQMAWKNLKDTKDMMSYNVETKNIIEKYYDRSTLARTFAGLIVYAFIPMANAVIKETEPSK